MSHWKHKRLQLLRLIRGESAAHMRARIHRSLRERAQAGAGLNWIDQGRREVSWQAK